MYAIILSSFNLNEHKKKHIGVATLEQIETIFF